MELKLKKKTENPLLEREEIRFEAEHPNAPTPSRSEVSEGLSSELGVDEELIVIEKLTTPHGLHVASGIARVYESKDRLEEYESDYLSRRTAASREKAAEGAPEEEGEEEAEGEVPEEEAEEAEEGPEEEAKEAEEEPEEEEPEEEELEKEEEEEKAESEKEEEVEEEPEEEAEEIDYGSLADQNISDIKEKAEELELDYQKLLDAEKDNKDRKTLKEWLESKIGGDEE